MGRVIVGRVIVGRVIVGRVNGYHTVSCYPVKNRLLADPKINCGVEWIT